MSVMHAVGIGLLAAVGLGVVLLGVGCTRQVGEAQLFHPGRIPLPADRPGRITVEIQVDSEVTLRGWYLAADSADTTVIYFYGNGESVAASGMRLAWMVDALQVNVLAVDYRGYGFSSGTPTVDGLAEDAVRGYDWLEAAGLGPRHVVAYGRSIGTASALELAALRPVDGLILEAPFPGLAQVVAAWQRGLPAPTRWFVRLRADPALAARSPQPIDRIAQVGCPLLVVHGAEDAIIPASLGRRMFDAATQAEKAWCELPGVGHNNLPINHPDLVPRLRQLIASAGRSADDQ